MTYDTDISTEVNLSKVLDEFLLDNDSPEVIISFLESHDSELPDIFSNSLCWTKMFQLDFVFRCGSHEIDWIMSKLKSIPTRIAAYLAWQICKSESGIADRLKFRMKRELSWMLDYGPSHHPYAGYNGRHIFMYDLIMFNAAKDQSIPEELSRMDYSTFFGFVGCLHNSLFRDRVLQLDVYEALNEVKRWNLINAVEKEIKCSCKEKDMKIPCAFLLQIIQSDASTEEKIAAARAADSKCLMQMAVGWSQESLDLLGQSDSFDMLYLNMSLIGLVDESFVIASLVSSAAKDPCRACSLGILAEWLKFKRTDLEQAGCAEVVEEMLSQKEAA